MTDNEIENFVKQTIRENVIDIPKNDLNDIYKKWQNNEKASNSVFDRSLMQSLQCVPHNSYLLGVDFPFWFGDLKANIKRIMIVGVDPLRNKTDFKKANIHQNVLISTPYALHSETARNGITKAYWAFVESLSANHFVYLTDIYKSFFYVDNPKMTRSYNYYPKQQGSVENQRSILIKEIDFLKPDVIITFGSIAFLKLTSKKYVKLGNGIDYNKTYLEEFNEIPVLPFMHLSGSTRDKNLEDFLKVHKVEKKKEGRVGYGSAYAEIIENSFINN
ncbi:hypothetical protein ES711_08680 [Gelidibacter salicanalis]|uniref:Uracil-DNA glycosylase-like domain-containing protein n=1 Tax=Gelidibacter salicanalis TaxID=291193 RepID=A0A5C7AJQ1_9FLAO|nr:uracil-DNA glycosylase family protein [Gelidibacter salicanalis]TXE08567.1 hypothetical protein ES711_08680 [Gelidibacter salicanalis]